MLFLDFNQAFDWVENTFIVNTLRHFGFGNTFLDMITMLHTDVNS